jgi:CDP-diacylglycerol pyrophosphatase
MLFRSSALLALVAAIDVGIARAQLAMPAAPGNPNALWEIVSTCFTGAQAHACACPALDRACCGQPRTPDRDVVGGTTSDFVAFRDLKACGCPAGFVAGLALPRARVSGIEDPRRPEGIWRFAWDVARSRIDDERQIALVLNPRVVRTQNQLHVHLLRLKPGERERIDALSDGPSQDGLTIVSLPDLEAVFAKTIADLDADRAGEHGILVMRAGGEGFRAVVTDQISPQRFTINSCK